MHRRLLLPLLLLLSQRLAAQTVGLPLPETDQLDSLEQLMFNTIQDADRFGSLLGDDYITLNADGVMENKSQTVERVRTNPLPKADTIQFSDQQQRVYGNLAIRTGRAKVYKAGLVLADFLYTQTWLYRHNRWQLIGWQGTMTGWPRQYPVLMTVVGMTLAGLVLGWLGKRRRNNRLNQAKPK